MTPRPDTELDPTTEVSSTLQPTAAVHGRCDERFDALGAPAERLAAQDDDGFALAVEVDGALVVDLWAGRAAEASLIHTFSTIKPVTAGARGWLVSGRTSSTAPSRHR